MWWLLLRLLPRPGLVSYGVLAALVLLQLGGVDVLGMGLDLADQLAGDVLDWIEEVIADQLNPL
ncbi:hypothetical protein GRX01_06615 [Halobaculum sp. WSA2]|uniref:Uncharacterized protein n=1 Tax=Halobaculum saliterrae TaxID=2073113 RepID=A0A6B0SWK6_9EURY|nr:hypothetical protein [Halobaculum saliterrae]MXR41013.1 hypothetical protein [Halobaculum saliterrae]